MLSKKILRKFSPLLATLNMVCFNFLNCLGLVGPGHVVLYPAFLVGSGPCLLGE